MSDRSLATTPQQGSKPRGGYVPSYLELSGEKELCVVCGDLASGLHYRCMTCEGCKGFFRRTIQKGLVYECKGDGRCPVRRKESRNACQHCRFQRALEQGMAKDLVLSEGARKAKRRLIEANRERRALQQIRNTIKSLQAEPELNVLSDHDSHLLQALTSAFSHFLEETSPLLKRKENGGESIGNGSLEEILVPHIQHVVSFAESFSAFASLTREDRVRLVKGGWLELLLVVVCMEDVAGRRECGAGEEVLAELGALLSRLRLDKTEAALFATLLLLNPERSGLLDPLQVEGAQDELLTALSRYHSHDLGRHPHFLLAVVHVRSQCARLNEELTSTGQLPILHSVLPISPN